MSNGWRSLYSVCHGLLVFTLVNTSRIETKIRELLFFVWSMMKGVAVVLLLFCIYGIYASTHTNNWAVLVRFYCKQELTLQRCAHLGFGLITDT